jgi:hypothetical protein
VTIQEQHTIETAVDEAIEALPDGDEDQLTQWVMEHPSLTSDIIQALADEGLKGLIRERAREMGITLLE